MIADPATAAEALRAAARTLTDAACDWRLSAGNSPTDVLHGALRRNCGAAVSFHALRMLRTLVLGSDSPGPLGEALNGLTAFQIADLCRAAAGVRL